MSSVVHDPAARVIGGKSEEKLITSFFVLYKTARIVDPQNAMFVNQSRSFVESLHAAQEQFSDVTIKIIAGRYFINDHMVPFNEHGQSGAASIVNEWKTLGVGGVTFLSGIKIDELNAFFRFMALTKPSSTNLEALAQELVRQQWHCVRLLSVKESTGDAASSGSDDQRHQFRVMARNSFFQAMSIVQEVMVNAVHDQDISASKTKRVVQSLIDHISRDQSSLVELAAIKEYDDYTYAHSTNVCVYALTLGVRLGFDRPRLSQLGFTALFHDIGKVKLPKDLIRKPDAYDENDWIQMQRHPLLGAKTILRNLQFDVHAARAARGAFEHHINNDFTGYPTLRYRKQEPNLFSRIISVVDSFDALTSGRVYLKKSIPPDEVLKKMRFQMTVKFDRFLLEIFNDIIGIYPAGSLVLLNTNELALVLTNNQKDKGRPYVKIVGNKQGLLEEPIWADLAATEHGHRKIIRLVDPDRYGLSLKDFILRD